MKTILFSTLALAATAVMAQERTVEHPDFETCSLNQLKVEKVTYGGDTTRITFSYKGLPNYRFRVSSQNHICTDGVCLMNIGAEGVEFDRHIYPSKSDSTSTFTLLFPRISADTKSLDWQEPGMNGWFYNNVQLQPGASLAHLAVPQNLRDKCLKIKGPKAMEAPKMKAGETVIRGKFFGKTRDSGEGFKAVVDNAVVCVQEVYNVEVADDGTFEVRIPLPISTQNVLLIADGVAVITMLATIDKVQEVYIDRYTLCHNLDAKPEDAPLMVLFAGANAAANNSLNSPKAKGIRALAHSANFMKDMQTNELDEFRNVAVQVYKNVEDALKTAGLDPVATEFIKIEARHQIIRELGFAKDNILSRYYRNGHIRLPEDEQKKIKEASIPSDFYDFVKTADLNNMKSLTVGAHCYRNLTFSLREWLDFPNVGISFFVKYVSEQDSLTPGQKALVDKFSKVLETKEDVEVTEEDKKILADICNSVSFQKGLVEFQELELKKQNRDVEQFFAELVGSKSEHDVAMQIFRMSREGDPIMFSSDTVSEARLNELTESCDAFYVQSLRDANDRVKAKLEARKPLIRSNVHNETTEGDFLQSVVDKFPGKVILVDIWATWCGGCLAINNQLNDLCDKYKDEMVLVRLADERSPKAEWERLIGNMTGEHYRLTNVEMNEVRKRSATEGRGYPTLFIIDKKGQFKSVVQHQFDSEIQKAIADGSGL